VKAVSSPASSGIAGPGVRRKRWRLNPVLARELKERMRRRRVAVVLTIYLAVLAAIVSAVYKAAISSGSVVSCVGNQCFPQPNALAAVGAGRPLFQWMLFFVLMLVCFIVPGVTSGAIASERERQTLVPLQVTLLSPLSVLLGKLLASLAFTVLLLVATLPLLSVAYTVGGVSFGEIGRGLVMVVAVAAAIGCLSIACSATFRRVQAATVASYGLVFVLAVGTVVVFGLKVMVDQGRGRLNLALLVGNPFVATADVLGGNPQASDSLESPFSPIQSMLESARRRPVEPLQGGDGVLFDDPTLREGGFWAAVPFWVVTVGLYILLAVASLWFAAGRIRAPAGRGA
jgi:ABC-type transport system involved in multi-copper enzyme maturation permease subunit